MESARIDLQEFNHRREYLEKLVNRERRGKKGDHVQRHQVLPPLEPYSPLPNLAEFESDWDTCHTSSVRKSTLKQRLAQSANGNPSSPLFSSLLPLRTHLRTHFDKLCGGCESILVKVESKAQILQFPVKSMAYDRLPRYQVLSAKSTANVIVLRCYNPSRNSLLIDHGTSEKPFSVDLPKYELPPASSSGPIYKNIVLKINNDNSLSRVFFPLGHANLLIDIYSLRLGEERDHPSCNMLLDG